MKVFRWDFSLRTKVLGAFTILFVIATAAPAGAWLLLREQQRQGAAVINAAGRQRMRTQKMVALANRIARGETEKRESLRATVAKFEETLSAFREGGSDRRLSAAPPAVQPQIQRVRVLWTSVRARLDTISRVPRSSVAFKDALAYVHGNSEALLRETDQVVQRYQAVYEERIRRIEHFLVGAGVVLVGIIGTFFVLASRHVVQPLVRLKRQTEAVAAGERGREITVVEADDEIGSLTRSVRNMKTQLVQSLRETEIFRTAVENAGHCIYWTDADGVINHVNPAFEEVTGYDREEAVGATPRMLKSGEHDDAFYEDLWSTITEGDIWKSEITDRRSDGEPIALNQTIAPIEDEEGRVKHYVAVASDITEQKKVERRLREERDRLETLFESLPVPAVRCIAKEEGTFISDVNQAFSETFGIAASDAERKDINQLIVPPDRQHEAAERDRHALTKGLHKAEGRRETADGIRDFHLCIGSRERTERPPEIYATYVDVTERKEEERRRRQVIRRVTDAIVEVDADWQFTLVNDQAEALYAMKEEDLIGENFWEVFPEAVDTRFEKTYRQVMNAREPESLVEYDSELEGWFDVQVYPNDDGGVAFYFTEITERKERERRIARQKALLEALTESTIDGLLVVDSDRHVVFHNDRLLDIWDVSKDILSNHPSGELPHQVLLDSVHDLVPDPDEYREKIQYLYDRPKEESHDWMHLTDGRWIDRYSTPIIGEDGTHYGRLWVYRDVTEQRRLQERLLEVQEEERRRINQEIHDEMGGLLSSLQLTVDLVCRQARKERVPVDQLDQIEELVSDLSTMARTISRKLYPSDLGSYGLTRTLPALVREMEEKHNLDIELYTELEAEERFSELMERTVYWIIQEALVNVAHHAETDAAQVVLNKDENQLSLHILDEGVGFDSSAELGEESFGLEGIRRRVERLNGAVDIETDPGEGTRVSATLPFMFPLSEG